MATVVEQANPSRQAVLKVDADGYLLVAGVVSSLGVTPTTNPVVAHPETIEVEKIVYETKIVEVVKETVKEIIVEKPVYPTEDELNALLAAKEADIKAKAEAAKKAAEEEAAKSDAAVNGILANIMKAGYVRLRDATPTSPTTGVLELSPADYKNARIDLPTSNTDYGSAAITGRSFASLNLTNSDWAATRDAEAYWPVIVDVAEGAGPIKLAFNIQGTGLTLGRELPKAGRYLLIVRHGQVSGVDNYTNGNYPGRSVRVCVVYKGTRTEAVTPSTELEKPCLTFTWNHELVSGRPSEAVLNNSNTIVVGNPY